MTPAEVRAWLARHDLAAHRERGQNFLVDDRLAAKLVRLAGVEAGAGVLEIGTGLGILTRALAERAARVTTVEIDAGLVRALAQEAVLPPTVELVHGDALVVDLAARVAALPRPVHAVANLPYAVASPLLRRLLDLGEALASWSVMVQREVAERLAATPGSRAYGSLTVIHAWSVAVRPRLDLHPQCFYPVPRVVSRFVRITPRGVPRLTAGELARLEPIVRAGFGHRRKTLTNALRSAEQDGLRLARPPAEALAQLGLGARIRAQELDPEAWLQLARALADGSDDARGAFRDPADSDPADSGRATPVNPDRRP